MARNAAERRGGGWLKLLGLGIVVAGGLAAAAIIVPPMLFQPAADVALIKAEETPFKVKPKDPGGINIPHTETTVMGMIDDLTRPEDATEVLRPPAVVPEMPPAPAASDNDDVADDVAMAAEPTPVMTGGGDISQADIPTGSVESDNTTGATGEDAGADADGMQTSAIESNSPANAPAVDTVAQDDTVAGDNVSQDGVARDDAAGVAVPQARPTPPKRVVVEGDEPLYVVQLAAFRKADTAREQAGLLAGKHKARLENTELGTMKSDSGDSGIFWRVVTEPLPRADADRICAALKRAGQDCILRKYAGAE